MRRIVVTAGQSKGVWVELAGLEVTIGRHRDSTVVIVDHYASQKHCRLVLQHNVWLLEDLGSTNGTYLDRGKINAPTPVPIGLPIQVGGTTLEIH